MISRVFLSAKDHGHTLGGAEGQVETANRLGAGNPAEHLAGDGIGAVLEHSLEVLRGDRLADSDTATIVETDESGAQKDPRGSASFAVVANQIRLVGTLGTIAHGDGFEQVLVARSDAESSNGHHVVGTPMRHNGRGNDWFNLECQTCEAKFRSHLRSRAAQEER